MIIKSGFTELEIDNISEILGKRGLLENGRVQKVIDSDCIGYCDPYTPMLSGELIGSVSKHSKIGSGLLVWGVPYAHYQDTGISSTGKPLNYHNGAMRGANWFGRMKADHLQEIVSHAQKEM